MNVLISNSKSILKSKIALDEGKKCRRKIIHNILSDTEVLKAIKSYVRSENESYWILFANYFKMPRLLEFLCTKRAQKIVMIRKLRLPC